MKSETFIWTEILKQLQLNVNNSWKQREEKRRKQEEASNEKSAERQQRYILM